MKQLFIFLVVLLVIPVLSYAQEEKKDFGIKFSGFVKADYMFDTRQTVTAREGHFLLYPAAISKDSDGKDINEGANLNMLAVQSRLKGAFTGPDAFGAKTSGVLEGAFFGHTNADINGFRLRHAFVKLDWGKTNLIFGQYWHAMFVTGCFPGTVSFNTGVPFQPFSRNPQIRLTHKAGPISIIAAIQSQRDFASTGGSTSLRNSGIPDFQFQLHYGSKNEETGKEFLAGIGAGYKFLKPTLSSTISRWDTVTNSFIDYTYKSDEMIASYSALAFIKYKMPALTIKLEGVYGQNMTDLLMLGGYADYAIIDTAKNTKSYTNYNTMSAWLDVHTNGKKFQVGLFGGYTENLGVEDTLLGSNSYARGTNIKSVMRVSPRCIFISGKTKFAVEIEYTSADYQKGDSDANPLTDPYKFAGIDNKGVIQGTETTSNIRFLFSVIHSF